MASLVNNMLMLTLPLAFTVLNCIEASLSTLKGDLRLKTYNCKSKSSHWSRLPPLEHFECEYKTNEFTRQYLQAATLIYQRNRIKINGYKCRGKIEYTIQECTHINNNQVLPFNFISMFLSYGNTKTVTTSGNKQIKIVPITKQQCDDIVEYGEYKIKHDILGVKYEKIVKLGPANHPIFLRVAGYRDIGRCQGDKRIIINGEFRDDIVIEADITLDYKEVVIDAYPEENKCELHYEGIKHIASDEGYQSGTYTLAYDMKDVSMHHAYSQKTFFNVTLLKIGEDNHVHLNIGDQHFLELELNATRDKKAPIAESEEKWMLGTTVKGLYLCQNCSANRQVLSKMLPDQETSNLELKLKTGNVGVRVKLASENFVIIENSICKIQGFLSMLHRAFPMSSALTPGVVFKEKHGITYYKICKETMVSILQDRGMCTDNLPVLFEGGVRYLEHKSQVLLSESNVRSCATKEEHRYRVINASNNRTLDICGGPQYWNCTDQNSRRVKIPELHRLDTYSIGNLFDEIEHIEKLKQEKEDAREMYEHEKNNFEQDIEQNHDIGIDNNTNSTNKEDENEWFNIWSIIGGYISFETIFNLVLRKIKNWAFSLPVIGYLIEFAIDFSEAEKTKVILLSLSVVEAIYYSIKNVRINIMQICLLGVYFLCPPLFLYVKIISKQ